MLLTHHFAYHVKQTLSRRNTRKTNPKAFHTSSVSSWRHYVEHAMLALIASYGARKQCNMRAHSLYTTANGVSKATLSMNQLCYPDKIL